MRNLIREWGFPAGLGTLWVLALVYTLHAVSGLPQGQPRREAPVTRESPSTNS
ncbi:MAG: hypothetical protein ABR567_04365 [Myxococcales bacterium]|nr:hypothetical protein [Myxococcales bacterium]